LYKSLNSFTCPICSQKTNKRFEELSKNRYILQYIESKSTSLNKTSPASSSSKWNRNEYYQMFFNEIDTHKNGRITRDQLYAALNKNTLVSESFNAEKIKILFDKNVTKHTSHMSFKEFSKILDDLNGKYEEYEESNEEYVYLDKSYSTTSLTLLSIPSSKLIFELDDTVTTTDFASSSSLGQEHFKAYLSLTNVSATRVIVFKIKTNLSVRVRATPSQATLKPNETLSIRFCFYKTRQEKVSKDYSGKLLIKYVIWNDEEMASVTSGDEFLNKNWKSLGETRMNYLKMEISFKDPKILRTSDASSEQKLKTMSSLWTSLNSNT
jgi:Ca2+-binding EF-hand superfamily protein